MGSSFGLDRLLAALKELNLVQTKKTASQIIVTSMDKERMADYFAMAFELRTHGWNVEVFVGNNRRIPKQLQYADRLDIPVAVIAGSDEFENGQVTIKNLKAGRAVAEDMENREEWLAAEGIQVTVSRAEMISVIEKMLKS